MKTDREYRFWVLVIAVACGLMMASLVSAAVPRKKLVPHDSLPPMARALLVKTMDRHARDMTSLQMAILLLDFETIEEKARELKRPMFARPVVGPPPSGSTAINSEIPERFFSLQDQFHASIAQLQEAAHMTSVSGVTEAYANTVRSCVGCHAAYLYQDGGDRPTGR
jgi:cytochrome c556